MMCLRRIEAREKNKEECHNSGDLIALNVCFIFEKHHQLAVV